MPKTDHWRTADGPLPYVETEEAFDHMQAAGPKITREEFDALKTEVDELQKRPVAGNQVTRDEFKKAISDAEGERKTITDTLVAFNTSLDDAKNERAANKQALADAQTKVTKELTDAKAAIETKMTDAGNRLAKLETDAANAKKDAQELQKALKQATADLGKADDKLKRMDEIDAAIGRIVKATAKITYSDLNTLIAKLKENGATDADLKLFGIKT